MSEAEIEAAKTAKGGWTKAQLAEWGVPWPPPKGWKKALTTSGTRRGTDNNSRQSVSRPETPGP
jgi:hypothetical protein